MQLIIETDEEYAPMFRAVAKAVKAQVKTSNVQSSSSVRKTRVKADKGPFIDPGAARPGGKPSELFKGAWKKDPARTAKSIRESAWKQKG